LTRRFRAFDLLPHHDHRKPSQQPPDDCANVGHGWLQPGEVKTALDALPALTPP